MVFWENIKLRRDSSTQKMTIYTKIGLAVLVIYISIDLFNPQVFYKGFVSLVTAIFFLLINIINLFRELEYGVITMLVGIYFLVQGVDTFFSLEISYIPIISVVLMVPLIFLSCKSLKKD